MFDLTIADHLFWISRQGLMTLFTYYIAEYIDQNVQLNKKWTKHFEKCVKIRKFILRFPLLLLLILVIVQYIIIFFMNYPH